MKFLTILLLVLVSFLLLSLTVVAHESDSANEGKISQVSPDINSIQTAEQYKQIVVQIAPAADVPHNRFIICEQGQQADNLDLRPLGKHESHYTEPVDWSVLPWKGLRGISSTYHI